MSAARRAAAPNTGQHSPSAAAAAAAKRSAAGSARNSGAKGRAAAAAAAAAAEAEAARAAEETEQYYFEEVEVPSDGDEDESYAEVPLSPGGGATDEEGSAGEDYAAVVSSLRGTKIVGDTLPPIGKSPASSARSRDAKSASSSLLSPPPIPSDQWIARKLRAWRLFKTLEMLQAEWADLEEAGQLPTPAQIGAVPHEQLTMQAERNESRIVALEKELNKTGTIATQAKESWSQLKRERDYHRMHHGRVVQEKEVLIRDLKRLKRHYESFEPSLAAMKAKYEAAMKEKMMMRLERDRCKVKAEALEAQIKAMEDATGHSGGAGTEQKESNSDAKKAERAELERSKKFTRSGHPRDTPFPPSDSSSIAARDNPYLHAQFEPVAAHQFQLRKTFRGHRAAISAMAMHPKKSLLCTVSDDHSWKMWSIPKGDLVMAGEGHRDWISSCDFHPGGALLATSSGDGTVKLWDFMSASCSHTYAEHTQAVWDVAFHEGGDFFCSASMDHTAKLWDLASQRCRQTFRGHVDSVNSVVFQPFSSNLCTASGDKTVSLWDMRSGLCAQTFYGHQNAVSHASFNLAGDTIISADADGVVKMWDVRLVGEKANFRSMGNHAVNEARLDRSGRIAALASDDGTIKIFSTSDGQHLADLEGHEDAVQAVLFDPNGQFLVSASSDQTFRIWS